MKKKIFLLSILFALVFVTACTSPPQTDNQQTSQDTISKLNALQAKADNVKNLHEPAPEFKLVDIYGKEVSKQELLGKPYVVQAFASWCYSCIEEAGRVNDAYKKFKDKGLKVVYVSIWDEEDNETLEEFRQTAKGPAEWYWNTAQDDILTKFDIITTDSTRIIDKEGYVVYADDGPTSAERLTKEIEKIIGVQDNMQ